MAKTTVKTIAEIKHPITLELIKNQLRQIIGLPNSTSNNKLEYTYISNISKQESISYGIEIELENDVLNIISVISCDSALDINSIMRLSTDEQIPISDPELIQKVNNIVADIVGKYESNIGSV